MALHGAEREHRLKAIATTGFMHNRMLIVIHCRGQSAYLKNRTETERRFLGLKNRNRTEFLKTETVTALHNTEGQWLVNQFKGQSYQANLTKR